MAHHAGGLVGGKAVKDADKGVLKNVGTYISDLTYKYWKSGIGDGSGVTESAEKTHGKDTVMWMTFDVLEGERVLVVGYNNGFSIWKLLGDSVVVNGGGHDEEDIKRKGYGAFAEITSKRKDAPIKQIACLPPPDRQTKLEWENKEDKEVFRGKYPVLAALSACDTPAFPRSLVKFYSLNSHQYINQLKFRNEIQSLRVSHRFLVVMLSDKLYGFHLFSLEKAFALSTYPSPVDVAVCALNTRWIAYPTVAAVQQDSYAEEEIAEDTGNEADLDETNSSGSGLSAAKIASGLFYLGDMAGKLMSNPEEKKYAIETQPYSASAGTVAVFDAVAKQPLHSFRAHTQALCYIGFDDSGTQLLTASVGGHCFHVFKVFPGKHIFMYKLYRGITNAVLNHAAFSSDGRWVACTTRNGTTHVFAIRPSGGEVNIRSHPPALKENEVASGLGNGDTASQFHLSPEDPTNQRTVLQYNALSRIHHYSQSSNDDDVTARYYSSDPSLASPAFPPVSCYFPTFMNKVPNSVQNLLVCSAEGAVSLYGLSPTRGDHMDGYDPLRILLQVKRCYEWDICRRHTWPEILEPVPSRNNVAANAKRYYDAPGQGNGSLKDLLIQEDYIGDGGNQIPLAAQPAAPFQPKSQNHNEDNSMNWLSKAELQTYAMEWKPLWMGPQFHFKRFGEEQRDVKDGVEGIEEPVELVDRRRERRIAGVEDVRGRGHENTMLNSVLVNPLDQKPSEDIQIRRKDPVPFNAGARTQSMKGQPKTGGLTDVLADAIQTPVDENAFDDRETMGLLGGDRVRNVGPVLQPQRDDTPMQEAVDVVLDATLDDQHEHVYEKREEPEADAYADEGDDDEIAIVFDNDHHRRTNPHVSMNGHKPSASVDAEVERKREEEAEECERAVSQSQNIVREGKGRIAWDEDAY